MATTADVIAQLNILLKNELTAINQYFLHSRTLRHLGYNKLADKEYEESIDEMKHADWLIKRILMLEGFPNLQSLAQLKVGEHPIEMLEGDLAIEHHALADLKIAHAVAEEARDRTSISLIEDIIKSEEEHVEWLTSQLKQVEAMGAQNYLQTQV